MSGSRSHLARLVPGLAAVVLVIASGGVARAVQPPQDAPPATITGIVTAQGGVTALPSATVRLVDEAGQTIATTLSDATGRFRLSGLPAGRYRIRAMLAGFSDREKAIAIRAGQTLEVKLDLDLATVSETVTVVPPLIASATAIGETASTSAAVAGTTLEELPIRGDGIQGALRLIAGVIEVPGGVSIKGGRPTQSSLQLGSANVTDASTGAAAFRLPIDAIESVEVLPNPYAVEFGRFSSGLTVLKTRRGGAAWKARINNFIPSLRTKRRTLRVLGVERFGPQFALSGPLVENRLFLSQSVEFRYEALDTPSRPESDVRTGYMFNGFTRVDVNAGTGHGVTVSLNVFPQKLSALTMDTFTPPEVAADLQQQMWNLVVSDTATLSEATVLDTLIHVSGYTLEVGHKEDTGGIDIWPQGNEGTYFNAQHRHTKVYQWTESWSRFVGGRVGTHLIKAGFDVLHTKFEGTSQSAPVTIRRLDGTVARRLTFGGPVTEQANSTDAAVFVQDRWRPTDRLLVDAGVRLDRDGVLGTTNGTVRAGAVVALNEAGTVALRGGVGLFYERTPSIVDTFEQFEDTTEVRFDSDGVTALGPPLTLLNRTDGPLRTPRSLTWNTGYDHRVGPRLFLRVNYLSRTGAREFVLEPTRSSEDAALTLSSSGRSSYRELELSTRFSVGPMLEVHASYVRSSAKSDLNAYGSFFGTIRSPLVSANEFGPSGGDVPHRILGRARFMPAQRWLFGAIVEFRSGFPYSAVDEQGEIIAPPNRFRFPDVTMVDLSFERRFKIFRWEPWLGFRIYNALNEFNPADVQRNVTSPEFGGFFSSRPRQIRLQMRFQ